ncbi:MAG: M20/M25/M40 family metallo-hydrolase [Candidatus Riflebacteria bacterium]|nr:M20/M25/M40 family metallo-hydrolase [Candidatus Riflebacteria bacterium]
MITRRERIEPLFLRLIAARSDTNTSYELVIEEILLSWLKSRSYFTQNPDNLGTCRVFNDQHHREVVWALVKGQGSKTIVLMHHHDAVDIEDYGKLKYCALRPDELMKQLKTRQLNKSTRKDLESGEWLFARGCADMKSGAAIQLALLDEFSEIENFVGNVLLISVPDEETISKGMLSAVELMCELREKHQLEYVLTINSEPYFNQVKDKAIMYEGSVGKIMPVVFVKGVRSHISDPYNGINPSLILAHIQCLSELNVALCDQVGDDATPPPVWVNLKDRKRAYDASIPDAASGYFNWLTFTRSPVEVLDTMCDISQKALEEVMYRLVTSYSEFCRLNKDEEAELDFVPRVLDFKSLHQQALDKGGDHFLCLYEEYQLLLNELLSRNEIVLPEATIRLIEFTADYIDLEGPAVVIAVSGPYYPHVSNLLLENGNRYDLAKRVNAISLERYGVEYTSKAYFMGISDLSYATWVGNAEDVRIIKDNSPGWDTIYRIPFAGMQSLKMPVVNIGPWGKDLHKMTERVYIKDVYERVPEILAQLISDVLASAD